MYLEIAREPRARYKDKKTGQFRTNACGIDGLTLSSLVATTPVKRPTPKKVKEAIGEAFLLAA
eukprot:12715044-Prorocentrum_lima.AAC.1